MALVTEPLQIFLPIPYKTETQDSKPPYFELGHHCIVQSCTFRMCEELPCSCLHYRKRM